MLFYMELYDFWTFIIFPTNNVQELIGPYWSLRAALGPVLETFLLLDRLLFLQEQGSSIEAVMLPIFDPALSPRNVAIIAKKSWQECDCGTRMVRFFSYSNLNSLSSLCGCVLMLERDLINVLVHLWWTVCVWLPNLLK